MAKTRDSSMHGTPLGFWPGMIAVLPKIKTPFQFIGLLSLIGGFVAYRTVPQELVPGTIVAGVVGSFLLFIGLVFPLIEKTERLQSPFYLILVLL